MQISSQPMKISKQRKISSELHKSKINYVANRKEIKLLKKLSNLIKKLK